jgi:hypothetical protein
MSAVASITITPLPVADLHVEGEVMPLYPSAGRPGQDATIYSWDR